MRIVPGMVLLDRFRVDSYLGSGGMGTVFRVWDSQRNASLAVKALHEHLAETSIGLSQLEAEAKALQQLMHPNIVPFYGFYEADDNVFLLEEFVEGVSLKEILKNKVSTPLSGEEVLSYLKPVCAALQYAHNQGIVHCDVKPGNILRNQRGQVYLTDFGIAHYLGSRRKSTAPAGTPAYMAPEQIRGDSPTPQTDIYALGILVYTMLTGGQLPFAGTRAEVSGTNAEKVLWEQIYLPPISPRHFNPAISSGVEAVILRCLEKDANRRYSSVLDFLNELAVSLTGTPQNPSQVQQKTQNPLSNRSWIKKYAMWAVIALALLATLFITLQGDTPGPQNIGPQVSVPTKPTWTNPVPHATLTPTPQSDYPVMACMTVQWDSNNQVEECVTNIYLLDDGKMRYNFTWTAKLDTGATVEVTSSLGNRNMYLLDNLGNRYDALQVGDGATQTTILRDGVILSGWFIFPAAADEARYFIFYDDDNGVQTPKIDRVWP